MPYMIVDSQCTSCSACEAQCPNTAIFEKDGVFVIDPKKCTECVGFYETAQCADVCPVDDTCIVNPDLPRYQATA